MVLWPARIVTPQATYEPAHLRFEHGVIAEMVDKAGVVVETMHAPTLSLVAEGAQTGQHNITQRWQVTNAGGERWLAELTTGCGCGGTRVTGSNPLELAW